LVHIGLIPPHRRSGAVDIRRMIETENDAFAGKVVALVIFRPEVFSLHKSLPQADKISTMVSELHVSEERAHRGRDQISNTHLPAAFTLLAARPTGHMIPETRACGQRGNRQASDPKQQLRGNPSAFIVRKPGGAR
jgi:hypothetical protein